VRQRDPTKDDVPYYVIVGVFLVQIAIGFLLWRFGSRVS
jgi:hypothetical protein